MIVYVVMDTGWDYGDIDSVWATREMADRRATIEERYHVEEWAVLTEDDPAASIAPDASM